MYPVAARCRAAAGPQLDDSDAALRYECRLLIGPAVRSSMRHAAPASRRIPTSVQEEVFESSSF